MSDIDVQMRDHVAVVEIRRPPNNFFDTALISALADAYDELSHTTDCRAIVLCSVGKHFCAGADLSTPSSFQSGAEFYEHASRLFTVSKPVVAAVQGAAIGGGLGLSLTADFRVGTPTSRFAANFSQLGLHHGFGLTITLPPLVGQQRAARMLLTGQTVAGDVALGYGLVDELVAEPMLRPSASALADQIATAAPLAVQSIRHTLRRDLAHRIRSAAEHENVQQSLLRRTSDFTEGVTASRQRRAPRFAGS